MARDDRSLRADDRRQGQTVPILCDHATGLGLAELHSQQSTCGGQFLERTPAADAGPHCICFGDHARQHHRRRLTRAVTDHGGGLKAPRTQQLGKSQLDCQQRRLAVRG